jgi:hypothetical protein
VPLKADPQSSAFLPGTPSLVLQAMVALVK